jgi:hypothetical protein
VLPKRRLFLLAFILAIPLAAEKQRDWQTGKVLDTNRQRYFAGTVGNSNTNGTVDSSGNYHGNSSGGETAVYRVFETFVIEGDKYVYLAQERLRWRWSKAANVTVNGPVKYAVEKRKLYLMDEDGKEHEMEVVKKTGLCKLPGDATNPCNADAAVEADPKAVADQMGHTLDVNQNTYTSSRRNPEGCILLKS